MPANQSSRQALLDAIAMWCAVPATATETLIDTATQGLVDDLDGPNLRMLAGTASDESQFVIESLVDGVAEELNLGDVLAGDPEVSAFRVLAWRFLAGEIDAHALGRWAHHHIGHEGASAAQPFVNLDDILDELDLTDRDEADVVAAARAEATALITGEPSPRLL